MNKIVHFAFMDEDDPNIFYLDEVINIYTFYRYDTLYFRVQSNTQSSNQIGFDKIIHLFQDDTGVLKGFDCIKKKKTRTCPNCKKTTQDVAKFCRDCGKTLEVTTKHVWEDPETMIGGVWGTYREGNKIVRKKIVRKEDSYTGQVTVTYGDILVCGNCRFFRGDGCIVYSGKRPPFATTPSCGAYKA